MKTAVKTSAFLVRVIHSLRASGWAVFLFALFVATAAAQATPAASEAAAASVLDVMPSDALGIVVINRPAELDGKVSKLGDELGFPLPGGLTTLKAFVGVKGGFDDGRAVGLLILPDPAKPESPYPVIAIPTSDYQKLIDSFQPAKVSDVISKVKVGGETALVAKKGDYALFIEPGNEAFLNQLLANNSRPADVVAWKDWIAEHDVTVVLASGGPKFFYQHVGRAVERLTSSGGVPFLLRGYAMMYQSLLQTLQNEVAMLGVGVRIEGDGAVRMTARGRLNPGGQFIKYLAGAKPLEGNPLAGLPNEPFVLAGAIAWSEKAANAMADAGEANTDDFPAEVPGRDKYLETRKASSRLTRQFRSGALALRVGKAEESVTQRATLRMTTTDAATYMKDYEQQTKAQAEFLNALGQSVNSKITVESIDIDGSKGLKTLTDMSGMMGMIEGRNAGGMERAMVKAIYGKDGKTTIFTLAADKHNVVCAMDEKHVRESVAALKDPKASLASDPGVIQTTGHLPKKVHFLGYLSPSGTVAAVNGFLTDASLGMMKLPDFPAGPPIGCTATIQPDGVEKCVYVPAETVKAAAAYLVKIQTTFGRDLGLAHK